MNEIEKVNVPEGRIGNYAVERFEVSCVDADNFNVMAAARREGRFMEPGKFTRLVRYSAVYDRQKDVIMSDTPAERNDLWEPCDMAHGKILIHGLGLGVILNACLQKPEVQHATVMEIQPEIINLVGPHYQQLFGDRLTIIQHDALTYRPQKGDRYNMIWSDIWDNICGDNLAGIKQLRKIYARKRDWHGCWFEKKIRKLC